MGLRNMQVKIKCEAVIATVILIMMSLASVSSFASEAMLKRFFVEVNTLQAEFTQLIVDESGATLEMKRGVFSLSFSVICTNRD